MTEFRDLLRELLLPDDDTLARELIEGLEHAPDAASVPGEWRRLAAAIARSVMPDVAGSARRGWPSWDRVPAPLVLGIAGGQGSGKSTLARALRRALELAGARAAACSLDDFYLTRHERQGLAQSVHPLLSTRGVPGTHAVDLLLRTLQALAGEGTVALPVFDKATDDRQPRDCWPKVQAPLDVLILEGWCVGSRPESPAALADPVNELEAREDPAGVWRRYVNDALAGRYAELWNRLDGLVYLQVPGMAAIERWRGQQEQSLPAHRRMTPAALERFIAHYERITRAMQADLPTRANLVVNLDEDHRTAGIRRNDAARAFRERSA